MYLFKLLYEFISQWNRKGSNYHKTKTGLRLVSLSPVSSKKLKEKKIALLSIICQCQTKNMLIIELVEFLCI